MQDLKGFRIKKMVYPRFQQRICVLGHRKDNCK